MILTSQDALESWLDASTQTWDPKLDRLLGSYNDSDAPLEWACVTTSTLVGAELVTHAHLLTVDLHNRYVSLLLILVLLIFSSASVRLPHFANEFHDALNHRDFAHIKDLAGRVVLLMGEIAVLCLVVFLLEKAVSWFYFYFFGLEYWLIVCWCVAAHFAFVGGIGYSEGDCDAVSVTTATATMGAFAPMYIHRTTRPFITLLAEY